MQDSSFRTKKQQQNDYVNVVKIKKNSDYSFEFSAEENCRWTKQCYGSQRRVDAEMSWAGSTGISTGVN